MRFMLLMIPKGYETAKPGAMPDAKAVAAMMKYNAEMQKAGILVALDGLHPPSMGARVSFSGGRPKVTDGPFAEAKEVLGGDWMMAAAKHRAIDHLRRHQRFQKKQDVIGREMEEREKTVPDYESALDDDVGDDLLRLMFTACHPVLQPEARLALTLRLLGGL